MGGALTGRQRKTGSGGGVACSMTENSTAVSRGARRNSLEPTSSGCIKKSLVSTDDLPEEIMISIFSHLSARDKAKAAEVCTKWRDLVYDPRLWTEEEATLHLDWMTSDDMASLERRKLRRAVVTQYGELGTLQEFLSTVSSLTNLTVIIDRFCIEEDLKAAFSQDLPQMRELKIKYSLSDPQSLDTITSHLKNLEVLEITGYTGNVFSIISKNLRNLKSLLCETESLYGDLDFDALSVSQLPSLVELRLSNFVRIGDIEMNHMKEGLPNLEVLSAWLSVTATEAGMQMLGQLSSLRNLELGQASFVPNGWLEHLLQGLTELRVLSLKYCFEVTEADAKSVAQLPLLEELSLEGLDDTSFEVLTRGLGKLRKLYLCNISDLSQRSMENLAKLTELQELALNRTFFSNDGMRLLSAGLPKLHTLALSHCESISDTACMCIARMASLQVINISTCWLTEAGEGYLQQSAATVYLSNVSYPSCERTSVSDLVCPCFP